MLSFVQEGRSQQETSQEFTQEFSQEFWNLRWTKKETKTWKQKGNYSKPLDDDFATNLKNPDSVMILATCLRS